MLFRNILSSLILTLLCTLGHAEHYEEGEVAYKARDYALAIKMFTLGAISGNYFSLQKLGIMKNRGEGNSNDIKNSFEKLKASAVVGNVDAQLMIGMAYKNANIVASNCKEGVRWLKLAASNGNEVAQQNLGTLYFEGECIPKNYIYGYMWSSLSVAQTGTEIFKRILDGYAVNKMTREQVSEAQRLASVCYINNYKNCN